MLQTIHRIGKSEILDGLIWEEKFFTIKFCLLNPKLTEVSSAVNPENPFVFRQK